MPARKPDAEDALEQAAIQLFGDIGWRTVNAYHETYGLQGTLGREHRGEVVLLRELRQALRRLNPGVAGAALEGAIETLTGDRSMLGMVQANREIYALLTQGVKVAYTGDGGEQQVETIHMVDWTTPANNDFLLVSVFSGIIAGIIASQY